MRIRCSLKLFSQRIILHFKSIGILFWIPIILVDFILPLTIFLIYRKYGISKELYNDILQYPLMIIPFSSCFWTPFILKEYIEGKGNEVLFVCKNKVKIMDTLIPFILFYLTTLPQYIYYYSLIPEIKNEPLRNLFICLFFYSVSLILTFISKSAAISIMVTFIYLVLNIIINHEHGVLSFPLFMQYDFFSMDIFMSQCLPMLVISVICIFGTYKINKNFERFN